jgi:anti-sigma regulatory factor (Ser/Thr protein kinase)
VALLWGEGAVASVLDLVRLWNELADRIPFALMCGYPAGSMTYPSVTAAFQDICGTHSALLLPVPTPADADATRQFPESEQSPAQARRFTSDWLDASGHSDVAHPAAIAVSELATNAVRHAHSDFTVSLSDAAPGVRITVGDRSSAVPRLSPGDTTTPGGRGLLLIDALAATWGYELVDGGKLVWVDLSDQPH